jgi:hypothetical protein
MQELKKKLILSTDNYFFLSSCISFLKQSIQPPHVLSNSRGFFFYFKQAWFQRLRKHSKQTKVNLYSKIARTLIFCQTFCPFYITFSKSGVMKPRPHFNCRPYVGLFAVSTTESESYLHFTHLHTFLYLNKGLESFLHLYEYLNTFPRFVWNISVNWI